VQTRAAVIGTSFQGEVGLDVIHTLKQKGVFRKADLQGFVGVLSVSLIKNQNSVNFEKAKLHMAYLFAISRLFLRLIGCRNLPDL
jgi:hypothetical protein